MLHTKWQLIFSHGKVEMLFSYVKMNEINDCSLSFMHLESILKAISLTEPQKMFSTLLTYPGQTDGDSEACPCGPVLNYQLFHSHGL